MSSENDVAGVGDGRDVDDGYYFEGLVDRPVPEADEHRLLGYSKTTWLKGEGIIGGLVDFEHNDLDIGRIKKTFVKERPGDGEWLGIGGRLHSNTKPELVQMIREWARLSIENPKEAAKLAKKLGFSIRYITKVDPVRKIKTGTTLKEVSFHRNPHWANAQLLVCQGKEENGEVHVSIPIGDLLLGSTKAPSDASKKSFSFPRPSDALVEQYTNKKPRTIMAAPAAPTNMEGVTTPPAAAANNTSPQQPPTPAKAAETSPASVSPLELMKILAAKEAELEELKKNAAANAAKAQQYEAEKAQQAKVEAEKRKADFMALKEHHGAVGINLEDKEQASYWDHVFQDPNAIVFFNAQLKSLQLVAENKKLLAEKDAKIAEYDKGLAELVAAKRGRTEAPAKSENSAQGQQQQQQQQQARPGINTPMPRTAEEALQLAKADPAIAELRAKAQSRESGGLHPARFTLVNGRPIFQWPSAAAAIASASNRPVPPTMATGGAPPAGAPAAGTTTQIPVAQGAGATDVHTGDPVTDALVGNPDDKMRRVASAFARVGDGVIIASGGRVIDLQAKGFKLPGSSLAALGNSMLNVDCGWTMPSKNFDREGDNGKRKQTIVM